MDKELEQTIKSEVYFCGIGFKDKYVLPDVIKFAKEKYDIDISKCRFDISDGFITDTRQRIRVHGGYKEACKFVSEFERKFEGKIYLIYIVRMHVKECPKHRMDDLVRWQTWHHWKIYLDSMANRIECAVLGRRCSDRIETITKHLNRKRKT